MGLSRILLWSVFFSLASLLLMAASLLVRCPPVGFAGVTEPYNHSLHVDNLAILSPCNDDCGCSLDEYKPVCGADGTFYYSPCFAGCSAQENTATLNKYYNCSCIDTEAPNGSMASDDHCAGSCKKAPIFFALFVLALCTLFVCMAFKMSVSLRCVLLSQRSMSLSFQWIYVRVAGSIPGPLVLAIILDSSCVLHSGGSAGGSRSGEGACAVYDTGKLANLILLDHGLIQALGVLALILAWKLHRSRDEGRGVGKTHLPLNTDLLFDEKQFPTDECTTDHLTSL